MKGMMSVSPDFASSHICCACVQLYMTLWTVARQAPPFMGFSRREYWNRLSFPSPEYLPDPRIKATSLVSPALQVDSLSAEPSEKPTHTKQMHRFPIHRNVQQK